MKSTPSQHRTPSPHPPAPSASKPASQERTDSSSAALGSLSLTGKNTISIAGSPGPSPPPNQFPLRPLYPSPLPLPFNSPMSILPLPIPGMKCIMRTFFSPLHPLPDTLDTLPELGLRGAELLEGGGEVLQVLSELVLEVRELWRREGGELDWRGGTRGLAGLWGRGYAGGWRGGYGDGDGEGRGDVKGKGKGATGLWLGWRGFIGGRGHSFVRVGRRDFFGQVKPLNILLV